MCQSKWCKQTSHKNEKWVVHAFAKYKQKLVQAHYAFVYTKNDCWLCMISSTILRQIQGEENKIPQQENCYIWEMPEYFCTKFCSFVWHNTVHCTNVLLCAVFTWHQIDGNGNFKSEFHNRTIKRILLLK